VQKALGLPAEKVPHNIERYVQYHSRTLPILFHECRQQGLVRPGMNVMFTALGSGLHWGAALYRTSDRRIVKRPAEQTAERGSGEEAMPLIGCPLRMYGSRMPIISQEPSCARTLWPWPCSAQP